VAVVSVERGGRGGSNGGGMKMAVAVLAEIWQLEKNQKKEKKSGNQYWQ
jgi:hypothetical protein